LIRRPSTRHGIVPVASPSVGRAINRHARKSRQGGYTDSREESSAIRTIAGENAPRINEGLTVEEQLTSNPLCEACTKTHAFQEWNMPLPRVWVTVRRMMVAVAVAALILYGEGLWRRHDKYERRAAINATYARQFREAFEKRSLYVFAFQHGPVFAATPVLRLKWAEYHENFAGKYKRAASRPWERVPPDPLPPEIFLPSSFGNY
jgi:hypothetical protein